MSDVRRVAVAGVLAFGSLVWAQDAESEAAVASDRPISAALESVRDDVRLYDEHLVILASPYMEGRVPGSAGMERAKDYVEHYMRAYGLEPAFEGGTSFRDPFPLGGTWKVQSERLMAMGEGGSAAFEAGSDYVFTGLGGTGSAFGEAVFVGYAIDRGPEGFSSFGENDKLTGKVAVMFRFEPMDDEGRSLWTGGGWSNAAAFTGKLKAVRDRGAVGAVIINPPGTADPRAGTLSRFETGGGGVPFPVMMMSAEAGEKLLGMSGHDGSAMDWRKKADEGGNAKPLGIAMTLGGEARSESLMAENVGGVIRGKGKLADEWIVVGAHLDHLGMGYFGSRSGPGELHPGADDNASGSAGVLLLAKKLGETLAEDDRDRRSILFLCFSGEESGLNGSRHYVGDPIVPLEQHTLMVNWDMIGRIVNDRLTVAGAQTGEGLGEFLEPFLNRSGLEIVQPRQMSGASDHTSFYASGIPVLFSIIADFHPDYHTPADVSWKINRVGAVKTVNMYHEILVAAATRGERFAYARAEQSGPRGGGPSGIKVRVGVMPGSYDEDGKGIPVSQVSPGGPAEKGGMLGGDRIVRWDGQKVTGVRHWMELLAKHEPGDEVKVGVMRDGEEVTLTLKLEGRSSGG